MLAAILLNAGRYLLYGGVRASLVGDTGTFAEVGCSVLVTNGGVQVHGAGGTELSNQPFVISVHHPGSSPIAPSVASIPVGGAIAIGPGLGSVAVVCVDGNGEGQVALRAWLEALKVG